MQIDNTKERSRLIKLIHVGRREIGMADDAWRAYLQREFKVTSSTQLSVPRLERALGHLRRLGFKPVGAGPTKTRPPHEWTFVDTAVQARRPLLRKLIMLAGGLGITKGRQVAYIEGIARQMSGTAASAGPVVKPLPMCDEHDLWRIVQAVAVHLKRKGLDPDAVVA